MSQKIHDISNPNDGLGDALREAFDNQNDMNTELYNGKVDKVAGKGLSDNNLTDELVNKINAENPVDAKANLEGGNNFQGNQNIDGDLKADNIGFNELRNDAGKENLYTLDENGNLSKTQSTLNIVGGEVAYVSGLLTIQTQINAINTLLTSDNINLDTIQEIVDAIEIVQTSLNTILINNLTSGGVTKALTAEQGKVLKGLIDALTSVVNLKMNKSVYDPTNKQADAFSMTNMVEGGVNKILTNAAQTIEGVKTLNETPIVNKLITITNKNQYYDIIKNGEGISIIRSQSKYWDGTSFVNSNNGIFLGHLSGRYNIGNNIGLISGFNAGFNNIGSRIGIISGVDAGFNNIGNNIGLISGFNAGNSNTGNNIGLISGDFAGHSNTGKNIGLISGYYAGFNNKGNSIGIISGDNAGSSNTGNYIGIISGVDAGFNNTGSFIGLISGFNAGKNNIGNNIGLISGDNAGFNNIGNDIGLISGFNAGYNNIGNFIGLISGYNAGSSNTGSLIGLISGFNAGFNNIGNSIGLISGYFAGYNNIGNQIVAIGDNSLKYNQKNKNTAVGYNTYSQFLEDVANNKSFDYSAINISTDRVTINAHGFGSAGEWVNVRYKQGTSSISGLSNNNIYQIKIIDANTISFRELITGSVYHGVNITAAGTGTGHILTPQFAFENVTVIGANAQPTKNNQVVLGDENVNEVIAGGKKLAFENGGIAQFISEITTAPTSSTDTGIKGEVRFVFDTLGGAVWVRYECIETNTWVKSSATTIF